MHYRNLGGSYFDPDHPDGGPTIRRWVERYKSVHLQMLTDTVDPNMEHYPALAYQGQVDMSFLCIWEAHDRSEFILSNSSFGLWEGVAPSGDHIHRVFVVSPRIAVVLRSNFLCSKRWGQ